MLQVKSVVILKLNPHILKHGGGIKMWLWLNVESESYIFRIWKESQNEEDWNKYCEAKKKCYESSICGYRSESLGGSGKG